MPFTKICLYAPCSASFTAKASTQRYCSGTCANLAYWARKLVDTKTYVIERVIIPENPETCWIWQGSINKKTGYGEATFKGRHAQAHRMAYEVLVGPIPEGMHILHARHCTSRLCINPRHLYCGTNNDNVADTVAAGHIQHGSSHAHTHLNERDIVVILEAYHVEHASVAALAEKYHIARATVRSIIQRKTWRHVLPGKYEGYQMPPRSKLTENDIKTICFLYDMGASSPKIAKEYDMTPQQIRNIIHRKSHAHVTPWQEEN